MGLTSDLVMGGRPRTGTGVGEKENCLPCLGSSREARVELGLGGEVEGEPENDEGGGVGENAGGDGDGDRGGDSTNEVENLESGVAERMGEAVVTTGGGGGGGRN